MLPCGDYDGVLRASCNLGMLEKFYFQPAYSVVIADSFEASLLSFSHGAVRHSLMHCFIGLVTSDEQVKRSLLRCFNEEVAPFFEKKIHFYARVTVM